ncbi:MAG: translocation/assembly module TamB domain-containing protein [Rhabdochlamydiaceae bacterium]|nr:translocation/assembly module TamB domain-containing protein [Rhabdochlamydiaceae bacterium]
MLRFLIRFLRKIFKTVAILLALGSLCIALLQTKWAKNQIRLALVEEFKNQGIQATIDGISGRLPFTWTIDALTLHFPSGQTVVLHESKIRLKILPLLKKQISINYLNVHEVHLDFERASTTHEIDFTPEALREELRTALVNLSCPLHLSIQHLHIDLLTLRDRSTSEVYRFSLSARGKWRKDNLEFAFDGKLSAPENAEIYAELFLNGNRAKDKITVGFKADIAEVKGEILLLGSWNTWQALIWEDAPAGPPLKGTVKTQLPPPHLPEFPLLNHSWKIHSELLVYAGGIFTLDTLFLSDTAQQIRTTLNASKEDSTWQGNLLLKGTTEPLLVESSFNFSWTPKTAFQISDFALNSADTSLHGDLTLLLPSKQMHGAFYGQARSLQKLQPWIPHFHLEGSLGIECTLSPQQVNTWEQNLHVHLFSKEIRSSDTVAEKVTLSAEIHDLYHKPYGTIELNSPKIYTSQLCLNLLNVRTFTENNKWTFETSAQGALQDPFHIQTQGQWNLQGQEFTLELTEATGEIAQQSFFLQNPCVMHWSPEKMQLSLCALTMGEGTIQSSFDFSQTNAQAHLQMNHFPLKTFSILHPNFFIDGSLTATADLHTQDKQLCGFFNAVLEQADVLYAGKETPLKAKGSLQSHLNQERFQIHASVLSQEGQFLDLACSLPLITQIFPLEIQIDPSKPISAEAIAEGKIEEIFDFVNIGSHHITGLISSRLLLSQTLASPALHGSIDWQYGSYENYSTGTALKEIDVHLLAEKDQLKMTSLRARDEEGSLTAEGTLQLKPKEQFPYEISAELTSLNALRFDMIDAHLTGPLYVTGTTKSALALGNLTVPKANIKIPDQLPYEIPTLPVTFINRPLHLNRSQITPLAVFPLNLDLELTAEDQVFVEGKGLKSEWKGSVHLTGTNMNVAADGKLDLMNGEYLFTGKIFKLSEGQIVFNDKPTASAYLKLSGILTLQDAEITAHLYGPLTSPQLTFQSNPHMTTSAILSRILFNKDLSDISQTEAIQLATTLMDLSGGATPGVMEAIRKTLGIDRLTIVPSEKNEIALQIGKYLTKGVMVTLSQSATSTQVIVEVELKQGFVFQAETQEEQEGKFSLKWRKNY